MELQYVIASMLLSMLSMLLSVRISDLFVSFCLHIIHIDACTPPDNLKLVQMDDQ